MIDRLREYQVIPVAAVDSADDGVRLCEALSSGGLPVIEVTFRTSAAEEAIRKATAAFPQMLVGAGTVLSVDDLDRAIDAGARFAVAPGCNPEVVEAAIERKFLFLPGVANPTDIELALSLGVTTLKYFPAESLGGITFLKAMAAPYAHLGVSFCPTGGINAGNMGDYLQLENVFAVGGSWMAARDLIRAGEWDTISALAADAVAKSPGDACEKGSVPNGT